MAGNQGNNRIVWESWQLDWLQENWQKITAQQLSDYLGIKRTKVREKLYELGLKKMELQFWTPEQVDFLKYSYRTIGDVELAEIFTQKWEKAKGWTKKHIEKKRRQLNLKRTENQINLIKERNIQLGRFAICPIKAWETRGGAAPEGSVRLWRHEFFYFQVIKTKDGWVHHARWLWEQVNGPIPAGKVIRIIDQNPENICIENLTMISMAENAQLNSKNRLPKELREIQKINNQLKKIIYDTSRIKNSTIAQS